MSLYFEDNFPGWSNGVSFRKPVNLPVIDTGGQVFNVRSPSFGASGGGIIDDTSALQAALTAANLAGGGMVFIPSGTYLINSTSGLNVGSNTILKGVGTSSIIKLKNSNNASGNLVKAQSVSNVWYDSFTIDGNTSGQGSGTNYGAYFGGVTNGIISNLYVKNTTGVGIHTYNSNGCRVVGNYSTGNTYHAFECEQMTNSSWMYNRGYANTLHGIIINPGELSGTGSFGLTIVGNIFDGNSQYGAAVGVANGDTSQHLSTDCIFANNIIRNNSQYGLQIYQQNGFVVANNDISLNGFFGVYIYQSSYNQVTGNRLHNNSQSSNGAYDEIYMEGSSGGYASTHNMINDNMILIDGTTKARYAINEGTSSDGPNTIVGNIIPNAGTSGRINSIATGDVAANNITS